jgi:two-component system, chemotaxis family, sensor kinase CheA
VTSPPEDGYQDRNNEQNAELRQLFFESAEELLQALNDQAMALEKSPGDKEALRSIRRTIHTLKGDSAACGYRELSELAHELEDVLALEVTAAASVPDIALSAADVFAAMLDAYCHNKKLPGFQPLRQAIAELASQAVDKEAGSNSSSGKARSSLQEQWRSAPPSSVSAAETLPPDGIRPFRKKQALGKIHWSEYERLAISNALRQGKRVYRVSVRLDPLCGMPIAARQMLAAALSATGELLAVQPADGAPKPMQPLEFAVASMKSGKELRDRCLIPTIAQNVRVAALRQKSARIPVALQTATRPQAPGSPAPRVDSTVEQARRMAGNPDQERLAGTTATTPDNLLRVDAGKIDSVLNLVGELILGKSMLQQAYIEFAGRFPKDGLQGKFSDAMAFQARVLNDLQRAVMKIRMVPVDQLFRRFPRMVRDVARLCGKEVDLVIQGEDTDLDKGILDAIAEPLTHLVRNAVGHGIESADERVRAGKPRRGSLQLNAYHQGNQVVIEVADDGRGISTERVLQRGLAQNILTPEQAGKLSEAETLNLIFSPGFSTAEEITELSGRGVGLDVVQSVLKRLKATVQIENVAGRGATFRLRLPLTLAIIKALLFRVEERLYAIPLNTVAEIARAREEQICHVEQHEVLQLRNEVLPLLRLGRGAADRDTQKLFVLVIHVEDKKFGLIVDALEGENELVIKALDDQSISTELVSGASILGNGRVVLILNLSALVEKFVRQGPDQTGQTSGLLWTGSSSRGHAAAGGQA